MTIRVGITGANGHIGRALLKKYPETFFSLVADVTRPEEVEMAIKSGKPDVIVHLASVSDVDVCEDPKNKEWVSDVNVRGSANVAEAALDNDIGFVLLSTSQVFSGKWWASYSENDRPNPINAYGFSKWMAETFISSAFPKEFKIVRTSYLFDYARLATHIDVLQKGNYMEYPTFIKRSFMYIPHFVESFYQYLLRFDEMPKKLHIAGTKSVSWFDFMSCIAENYSINEEQVMPRSTEIKGLAPRPYRAGLNVNLSKRLGLPQYGYVDGIKEMVGV